MIAIDSDSEEWSDRKTIFAHAQAFADSGSKLVKLEFPKTEMQIYGNTVLIYTTYVYEIERNGQRDLARACNGDVCAPRRRSSKRRLATGRSESRVATCGAVT